MEHTYVDMLCYSVEFIVGFLTCYFLLVKGEYKRIAAEMRNDLGAVQQRLENAILKLNDSLKK